MEEELWNDIPGFEGIYQLSNPLFRVRRLWVHKDPKIMRLHKINSGYLFLDLNKEGERTSIGLHTLIALVFVGPRPCPGWIADHKNENKLDNRPENLRWVPNNTALARANSKARGEVLVHRHRGPVDRLLDGVYIDTFKSKNEAERVLNIHHQAISFVCQGRNQKAGGYGWRKSIMLESKELIWHQTTIRR